jgi:hypothetical protein
MMERIVFVGETAGLLLDRLAYREKRRAGAFDLEAHCAAVAALQKVCPDLEVEGRKCGDDEKRCTSPASTTRNGSGRDLAAGIRVSKSKVFYR